MAIQAGSNTGRFNKKTIRDIDVTGKRVLVRVDYNVPTDREGKITDDSRIRASLPTIKYLLEHRAKIILASHFGRPKGKVNESMRLAPMAERLSALLGKPVLALRECVGPEVEAAVTRMKEGDIIMLENLRFHPEEEANEDSFARSLARLADIYVNDAFGAAHRAHASITGVARYLPSVAGFLMEKELKFLGKLLENPARPFVALMGGAKVSDKMGVIENILGKVDSLLIGGGMAATFLKARGISPGASAIESDKLEYAQQVLQKAQSRGVNIVLPVDVIAAEKLEANARFETVMVDQIPAGWVIADIGPETIRLFVNEVQRAGTIFWNGPQGVFEIEAFSRGTREIARAISESKATTIIGGGSTAEAVEEMGLTDKMTHVSTGGGASLEFLEGRELPGVAVLLDR